LFAVLWVCIFCDKLFIFKKVFAANTALPINKPPEFYIMSNNTYLQIGRMFFAISLFAIGIVHLVTGNFPTGLLPVTSVYTGKIILVYANSIALIIAGILVASKKYAYQGAILAAIIWLIWLVIFHLPQLAMTYNSPFEWTPTFEVAMLFGGALILMGLTAQPQNNRYKLTLIGSYIVGVSILVFAVLHLIYLQFITTLLLPWMPFKLFWAYVVMIAFFAAAISILTRIWLRLSSALLGLMFFIWFCILHIPLVIAHYRVEPQWTSIAVVLGASGVAFLITASTFNRLKY